MANSWKKQDVAAKGMALTRCENGHFYDSKKFTHCPYDGVPSIDFGEEEKEPLRGDHHTTPAGASEAIEVDLATRRVDMGGPAVHGSGAAEPEGTEEIDPVVGWLVCIHGPERGRDYRIHSENNFVGRSEKMDIRIENDSLISREKHTVVTFDPQNNIFYISPGDGKSLVYLNGKAVLVHQELKPYDEILIGATKLRFAPFCGDRFKWS